MMRGMVVVMAGALALAGCGKAAPDGNAAVAEVAGAVSQAEARAAFDALTASFASGDSHRVMQHYAPGALLFDAGHAKPTTDRNLQTQWTASFMTMRPADFTTSDLAIQPLGPRHFMASGITAFTADVGTGRTVLHVRFSQLFEKQADGAWKIIHEHISSLPPGTSA